MKQLKDKAITLVFLTPVLYGQWVLLQRDISDLKDFKKAASEQLKSGASGKEIADLQAADRMLADRTTKLEAAVDSMEKSAARMEAVYASSSSRFESSLADLRNFLLNNGRRRGTGD